MSATKEHYHDSIEAARRTKELPILFSTDMVRAILDGRKMQTRRLKGLIELNKNPDEWYWLGHDLNQEYYGFENKYFGASPNELHIKCPYGRPGDRLYVRETWCWAGYNNAIRNGEDYFTPIYRASENGKLWEENDSTWRWRPSIYMPRHICRLILKITDIRAERLHDITESDSVAEGCQSGGDWDTAPTVQFSNLWEKINGPGSWEQNQWVWVIKFKKIG